MRSIRTERYKLYHPTFKGKISLFSDLHFSYNLEDFDMDDLLMHELKIKPDYILITGDLVDNLEMLVDSDEKTRFFYFLKQLGMIAPVYVTLGNHDFYESAAYSLKQYKEELIRYGNVYILDNKNYSNEDVLFTGISMNDKNCKNKETFKTRLLAYKDLLETSKDKLNLFLCHSPKHLLEPDIYSMISSYDYFLCGHMHNGSIPGYLNFLPGTGGLIGPHRYFFPKNVRNTYKKVGDKLIVTGAVRTFHTMSGLEDLNDIYPIQDVVLDFDQSVKVYKKVTYEK